METEDTLRAIRVARSALGNVCMPQEAVEDAALASELGQMEHRCRQMHARLNAILDEIDL
jgi:hypothetical protein